MSEITVEEWCLLLQHRNEQDMMETIPNAHEWLAAQNADELAEHSALTPEQAAAEKHARELRAAAKTRRASRKSPILQRKRPFPGIGSGQGTHFYDAERTAIAQAYGLNTEEVDQMCEAYDEITSRLDYFDIFRSPACSGPARWLRFVEAWALTKKEVK